jgi:hypothetical protein
MSADRPTAPVDVRSTASTPQTHDEIAGGETPVVQSPWHGAFVQDVLPFLTSLGVHAALVILGILTYQAFVVVSGPATQEQSLTPTADLAAALPGIDDANLGPADRPDLRAAQSDDESVPPDATGFSQDRGDARDLYASGGEGTELTDDHRIGLGTGDIGRGNRGVFSDGDGRGPGRGGPQAPFGIPGGVPSGGIFTGKHVVRSVAYVCDASGSMLDKFEPLRDQLHRSISGLKPVQSFNVIFFQEEQAAGLSKAGLLPAVGENKRKSQQFLQDVHPTGPTDPIPALELAFRQRPELIWLLTDGDFPDNDAVLAFIRERNKHRAVKINTIAFVTRDEGYEKVLRTIAEENGGQFRFVAEAELE